MESEKINIWWLFLGGTVLLTAGVMMKSFPIFIFLGLAPFFAILDHTIESENFWGHAEMILVGLAVAFFAAFHFDSSMLVTVLIHSILFTLSFIGFAFVHENLGPRTGKFIVILIWLGLEYALVKIQWPSINIFLADSLKMLPLSFYKWTSETGYLGLSAWILISNWIFYSATLREGIKWPLFILGLAIVAGPIAYSYTMEAKAVTRETMNALYRNSSVPDSGYASRGELVARTCSWVSLLVLLFAGVKSKITK